MARIEVTREEYVKYSLYHSGVELAVLPPGEVAKYREVQTRLVFGDNYRTDKDGNPIEASRPTDGDPNHLYWVRKQELEKQSSLKELLASVKPAPGA